MSLQNDIRNLRRYVIGGTNPTDAASRTTSISAMVKYLINVVDGATTPNDASSSTGSISAMVKYVVANLNGATKSAYSTSSPEAIGVELIAMNAVGNINASAVVTQNLAYFIPLRVDNAFTVQRFCWRNGATINGNVRAALFNAAGTKQGTDTGSIAQSGASGLQSAAPSGGAFTVGAGLYFIAFVSDSATATFAGWFNFSVGYLRLVGMQEQAADFALVTPATLVAHSTDATAPWVAVSQLTTN